MARPQLIIAGAASWKLPSLVLMLTTLLATTATSVFTVDGSFSQGVVLQEETFLASASNTHQLWMQADGNLVIYKNRTTIDAPWAVPIWALNMYGAWPPIIPGPYKLIFQESDGNLVVQGRNNATVWSTGVRAKPDGPYTAEFKDNGVIELTAENGFIYWTSLTHPQPFSSGFTLQQQQFLASTSDTYHLWMQSDGNLAIYKNRTQIDAPWAVPIWALNMYGAWPPRVSGPYKMTLQSSDGNLVVTGAKKAVVWSSKVTPKPKGPYQGRLRDDGVLELVSGNGTVYWRTPPQSTYFEVGTVLKEETYIASPSGVYALWMQIDGNLVAYRTTDTSYKPMQGRPYWALQMYDAYPAMFPGPYSLVLQASDCNLVVLGKSKKVVWSTNVSPPRPAKAKCRGRIRNDGIIELVANYEIVYWKSRPYVV